MKSVIGGKKIETKWLKEKDNNSKFFHAQTKQRRARNRIISLYNPAGVWVSSKEEIDQVTVNYFEDLFSSTSPTESEEALKKVPSLILEQMNKMLTATSTEEEVRNALFMMHLEKMPRRDGMTALFSKDLGKLLKWISLS